MCNGLCRSKHPSSFSSYFRFLDLKKNIVFRLLLLRYYTLSKCLTPTLGDSFSQFKREQIRSPGLFSVFWPISTVLLFGCSLFFLRFPAPPDPFLCLWGPFRARRFTISIIVSLRFHSFFSSVVGSKFIISALTGGFSREFECQKISSSL